MTRTRNGAFVGTVPQDADVDVPTWKRVFLEIVQTWHYIFDAVTGENSPASAPVISTVNHGGTYGRGSNLGIQLMSQAMPEVSLSPNLADWTTGSFSLDVLIACVPIDVQVGDETFDVGITSDTEFHVDLTVHVKTSAWVTEYSAAMFREDDRPGYLRASVTATTTGLHYILVRAEFKDYDARLSLSGFNIGVRRMGTNSQVSVKGAAGNVIPITTATGTNPLAIETIHDEMVADDYAFAGHIVTKVSRQLNAFEEYLTGFPVAGNESLTQADSSTLDPTTSRFKAGGRKGYGNEPMPQFPVFAEALGCIAWTSTGANADAMVNTANPPTIGLTEWHAPYPRDASGATVSVSAFNCIMPDFPDGGSSTLAFEVIFFGINGKGDPTKWQARISSTAAASAWTAISNIAGTDFYKCTISAVDFRPDNSAGVNTLILQMKKNTAPLTYAFGEILVLGWGATFRP